jgi:hemerythrin-like metal-binding protein
MALFSWGRKYSVGVKVLDDQHAEFMNGLNNFHTAMMNGEVQSVAGPMLCKLVAGAREHFATEEKMMAAANFPGLAEHHALHEGLLTHVEEYQARIQQGDTSLHLPLLVFVRAWLVDHMLHEDQKYVPWLTGQGATSHTS